MSLELTFDCLLGWICYLTGQNRLGASFTLSRVVHKAAWSHSQGWIILGRQNIIRAKLLILQDIWQCIVSNLLRLVHTSGLLKTCWCIQEAIVKAEDERLGRLEILVRMKGLAARLRKIADSATDVKCHSAAVRAKNPPVGVFGSKELEEGGKITWSAKAQVNLKSCPNLKVWKFDWSWNFRSKILDITDLKLHLIR